MKKLIIVVAVTAISVLIGACGTAATPTATPNIQATVQARVDLIATATAIVQAQATIAAERTAIAATRTALATAPTPTSVPATRTPTPTPAPSTAPTPTRASIPTATLPPSGVSCPFYVYADWGSDENHYVPEGWMGDYEDITLDDNYVLDPTRPNVIQITYISKGRMQWAGIYWWDPPGSNWAEEDGGYNLSCATKLTFWARGENGGEKAEFKVGGLKGTYRDSLQPAFSTGPIVLTKAWTPYSLNLKGKNLTHIIGGFIWVTNKPSNPKGATIYLDDIRFE